MPAAKMRPAGVEPATFGSVDRRSIQLSYERMSMCFPAPLTNLTLSSTIAEKQGFANQHLFLAVTAGTFHRHMTVPANMGVAIFPGMAALTPNQAESTTLFTGAPRSRQRFFYPVFHHRQSRRLCEVFPRGALPGNIATPANMRWGLLRCYPNRHAGGIVSGGEEIS